MTKSGLQETCAIIELVSNGDHASHGLGQRCVRKDSVRALPCTGIKISLSATGFDALMSEGRIKNHVGGQHGRCPKLGMLRKSTSRNRHLHKPDVDYT